ncbi:transposase family protein [Methylobacterium sp. NEAU 140]|uniref:transposase family protein n=1 Tax=Methylobacterium sp. NEAU 140 TaxID=3064945 RepID=UPI0027370EC1|nr:transposase family protein [Methylobacterium sp. NEAU 140]MDP4023649.1 transposase family protein [Methylobacterium sp. NEAU 140]
MILAGGVAEALDVVGAGSLWDHFAAIPDRRGRKGRQHGLPAVLTLSLAAMLSRANDLRAVFRWGRRLPPEALFRLGLERVPCHATYHDVFKALDVAATEAVLGTWVRGAAEPDRGLCHVALDGKRLRGSAGADHDGSGGAHLVAAFASTLGGVIGQLQVTPDANEITAALTLLKSCRCTVPSSPATRCSASGRSARASAISTGSTCLPSKPTGPR